MNLTEVLISWRYDNRLTQREAADVMHIGLIYLQVRVMQRKLGNLEISDYIVREPWEPYKDNENGGLQ